MNRFQRRVALQRIDDSLNNAYEQVSMAMADAKSSNFLTEADKDEIMVRLGCIQAKMQLFNPLDLEGHNG